MNNVVAGLAQHPVGDFLEGEGCDGDALDTRAYLGAFRVIYVARLADAIYVLHCFQKKSQRTSREDVTLATRRYKELIEDLG